MSYIEDKVTYVDAVVLMSQLMQVRHSRGTKTMDDLLRQSANKNKRVNDVTQLLIVSGESIGWVEHFELICDKKQTKV